MPELTVGSMGFFTPIRSFRDTALLAYAVVLVMPIPILRRYFPYHNRVRLHSGLGYRSPVDYEELRA